MAAIIVLFTDFGLEGPYTGQVKTVLHRIAPGVPVIDLFADLPAGKTPAGSLSACRLWRMVSTGYGHSRSRRPRGGRGACGGRRRSRFPLVCRSGQRLVRARHAARRPVPNLGDLRAARRPYRRAFTAAICSPRQQGGSPAATRRPAGSVPRGFSGVPIGRTTFPKIVYIDRFGNAIMGLRAALIPEGARLAAAGRVLARRRTFSDVAEGEAFWYENSNGLAEIAVNAGRADATLGLAIGTPVAILP